MKPLWQVIEPVLGEHYWLRDKMRCQCGRRFDLLSAWRTHVAREVERALLDAGVVPA